MFHVVAKSMEMSVPLVLLPREIESTSPDDL